MDDEWLDDPEGLEQREEDLRRLAEPNWTSVARLAPAVVAVILGVFIVVGILLLRPTGVDRPDLSQIGIPQQVYEAVAVDIAIGPCDGTSQGPDALQCQFIEFLLSDGPDAGETTQLQSVVADTSPSFDVGDRIVMAYQPDAPPGFQYSFFDRQRRSILLWLAIGFGLAVVALGRIRGLAALAGLVASLFLVLGFIVPSILDGRDPVLVAVVGAGAIAYVALYAAHGFTQMTTVALLGTLAALLVTAILSSLAVSVAHFTGLTEDVSYVLSLTKSVNLQGLLLAGIVLGSLGAIDDVTVTQVSAVSELRSANPTMHHRQLTAAGMRVGRDHIASTVNTLFLAYAGASLPLLVFFVLSDQSLGTLLNSETVAVEAIRALVGSIGLISAVPLTTWLAAVLANPTGSRHTH